MNIKEFIFRQDELSDILMEWRKKRRLSVEKASTVLCIPAATIRYWEERKRKCPGYVAALLIEKLEEDLKK